MVTKIQIINNKVIVDGHCCSDDFDLDKDCCSDSGCNSSDSPDSSESSPDSCCSGDHSSKEEPHQHSPDHDCCSEDDASADLKDLTASCDAFDLICAGVSSIVCGAVESWETNPAFTIKSDDEDAHISIELDLSLFNNDSSVEKIQFLFFISLLKSIQLNYPNFIELV